MRNITPNAVTEIILDLNSEMSRLQTLASEIEDTKSEIDNYPSLSTIFYESIALKLHNFYTGCERIFQIVASELNSGLPSSYDWHRRLLERMSKPINERPAIISEVTAKQLKEYLAFRHVVRNIYGFELEADKINTLLQKYPETWSNFAQDITQFQEWLQNFHNSFNE